MVTRVLHGMVPFNQIWKAAISETSVQSLVTFPVPVSKKFISKGYIAIQGKLAPPPGGHVVEDISMICTKLVESHLKLFVPYILQIWPVV